MKLLLLIYLLTGVFNFTLGIIVWLKNPHNRIHQSFVGFILGVVAWIISLYFLYSIKQESILLQNIGRFNRLLSFHADLLFPSNCLSIQISPP